MLMMKIKLSKILIIIAIIIYVLTRLNTILNQGELFDEEAISVPGYHVWSAMADLDFTSDIFAERYEHAPLPRYFFGIFYIIEQRIPIIKNTFDYMYIPEKQMFLERIASMILGLATMYFLYKITNKIFGKEIAIITLFVYSTMPHLIPYSSGVTQESLLIFFSTLFIFIYLKYLDYHSNKLLLLLYALLPYLFYSKQMGIFYTIFIVSIFFDFQHYKSLEKIKIHLYGAVLAVFLLYISWPWLWFNPLNIIEHITFHTHRSIEEYFLGNYGELPSYYFFIYALVTIPITYLLIGLYGVLKSSKLLFKVCNRQINTLILWLIVPFLANLLPFKQDGIRYVITYQVTFSIFIAYGIYEIYKMINNIYLKYIFGLLVILNIISVHIKFQPYYLDYYNVLTGGINNVANNHLLEFSWWGEGTLEATQFINNHYSNQSILLMIHPEHVLPKLENGNYIMSKNPDDFIGQQASALPDLVLLGYNKESLFTDSLAVNYELVGSVNIDDSKLMIVYQKK